MMVKPIYCYNCVNLQNFMTCPEYRRRKTEEVELYLNGSIKKKKKLWPSLTFLLWCNDIHFDVYIGEQYSLTCRLQYCTENNADFIDFSQHSFKTSF